MLVSMKSILDKAKKEGYGVAAPNVFSSETVKAVFEASSELKIPVILDCVESHGIETVGALTHFYANKYPEAVVALNLDHGETFEACMKAIRAGFTSVMVDKSTLPYEENVAQVKEIVRIAHISGVSVEAELGHVGKGFEYENTRDSGLTNPKEAVTFVKETGIDCLAVAVGTSHGTYKGVPHIDFELLENISKMVDVPLVLHGGSGTGDENLKKAVEMGIQKINLYTDLSNAGLQALREYLAEGDSHFMCQSGGVAAESYKQALKRYMYLFNDTGRV